MNRDALTAIILAAGYSSRMGTFKPLLSLGGTTVLERGILLFRDVGIEDIVVVVGHRSEDLVPVLQKRAVRRVFNKDYPDGMLTSIVAGINAMKPGREAFFLLPVDIPLVRRYTILELIRNYSEGTRAIVYPRYARRRGHPPLISAAYAPKIIAWRGEGGLRAFLRQYEQRSDNVDVDDENVLVDMDTPDDYETLKNVRGLHEVPSIGECVKVLTLETAVPKERIEHLRKVTGCALRIGRALKQIGIRLDPELIAAAGLLQDFLQENSIDVGSPLRHLAQSRYPDVAHVLGMQTDLCLPDGYCAHVSDLLSVAHELVQDKKRSGGSWQPGHSSAHSDCGTAVTCDTPAFPGDPARILQGLQTMLRVPLEHLQSAHEMGPLESEIDDLLDEAWRDQ